MRGHDVVAAGRDLRSARRRLPYAQWIAADFSKLASAEAWQPLLQGIDALVNCVGVLQDGLRDDVQRVQLDGTKALFDGCVRAGVKRVIHISAIGAEPDGPSAFSRSKAAAETYLKELPLDWVILRPALVLGPAVYGGSAMLRGIAAFPGVVPVVRADARIQVIGLDDLTETVVFALAPRSAGREDRVGGCAPAGPPPRRYRDRDLRLARLRTATRAGAAERARKRGRDGRRRVGLPRLAQPRALDLAGAADSRRRRRPGAVDGRAPASRPKVSIRSSRRGRRACRTAGSRGSISSSRWRSWGSRSPCSCPAPSSLRPCWVCGRILHARCFPVRPGASLRFWRDWVLVRPAVRCALIVLLAAALVQIADHIMRPWTYFLGSLDFVAFKLPMVLLILFVFGILDDR